MELVVAAWKRHHLERLVNLELGRELDHPVTEDEFVRVCGLNPGTKIVYVEDWRDADHGLYP
jgi:hypothetical protein